MRQRSAVVLFVLIAWLGSTNAFAQSPEAFLVLGAGHFGSWTTEYVFANDGDTPIALSIAFEANIQPPCPAPCQGFLTLSIPSNGTVAVSQQVSSSFAHYLLGTRLPRVRARILNSGSPQSGADLPVFRVATLRSLNPTSLVFPIRPEATRTNLLLSNVIDIGQAADLLGDMTVKVDVLGADGSLLGTRSVVVPSDLGQTYIVDIGQFMGIPNPTSGQVRATRISGGGVMWGILPSLNADGTISITLGEVP
jgi:hypothetical protein